MAFDEIKNRFRQAATRIAPIQKFGWLIEEDDRGHFVF